MSPTPNTVRVAASRSRLAERGGRLVQVWIQPEDAKRLDAIKAAGITVAAVVRAGIRAEDRRLRRAAAG